MKAEGSHAETVKDCTQALSGSLLGVTLAIRLYTNRGFAHYKLGNHTEATADYTAAIDLNDREPEPSRTSSELHILRAWAWEKQQHFESALADYDRALDYLPGEETALLGRGITLCRSSGASDALAAWDRAQAESSSFALAASYVLHALDYCEGPVDNKPGPGLDAALESWAADGCPGSTW